MPSRPASALLLAWFRTFRVRGIVRRSWYEVRRRVGRAGFGAPQAPGALDPAWRLSTPLADQLADPAATVARANEVLAGQLRCFGGRRRDVGWPPRWHVAPGTGSVWPSDVEWSQLDDSGAAGDVKDVWELSRFTFVGPLCGAWSATGDARYPEAFWAAVQDWDQQNPAFRGPAWMCGQETSLRALAMLVGAGVLREHPATTAEREELLAQVLERSIRRVVATLGYALSQRNNHATSEAAFLFVTGCILPDHPDSARLRRRGARALDEALRDQIYPDGTHAQFSPTYHRLVVHTLMLVELAASLTGTTAPAAVRPALERSFGHLQALVEPVSGRMPARGGVDGALLLDLVPAPVDDFRPLLASLAAHLGASPPFGPGPWDEAARWLTLPSPSADRTCGDAAAAASASAASVISGDGIHAVLRVGRRRHRPAHADMLHLDLWIDGVYVAADPGTFRYSDPPPWDNGLVGEEVHNGPTVPGHPQAVRVGRFFWRSWHDATPVPARATGGPDHVIARLDLGGVVLHRLVARTGAGIVVLDLASKGPVVVRWNLPADAELDQDRTGIVADAVVGAFEAQDLDLVDRRADEPGSGWRSVTYGEREPRSVVVLTSGSGRIATCFARSSADLADAGTVARCWALVEAAAR